MRIAVVTTSWPRSKGDPSGHFVRTEALELAREHRVTVIAPSATAEASFDVVPLHGGSAFGWPGVIARLEENPLRAAFVALWMHRARRHLQDFDPSLALRARSVRGSARPFGSALAFDRVIAHWAIPCAWPIAHGTDAELDVVSHGSDVRMLLRMPRRVVGTIASRASRWRFVSEALLHRFLSALPSVEARMVSRIAIVKPCAIEIPDVRARIEEKKHHAPFVTSIGRLVARKNTERAIETSAKECVPLVIVGDGPERARLEKLARGTPARFVGQVEREEALAWLGASRALWFSGREEGAPTVLREAEALGVPVRLL